MTPSEKAKLFRDVKDLFSRNDELDERQSAEIEALKGEVAALKKQVAGLEVKCKHQKKASAND